MNNFSDISYCSECLMPSSRPRITFEGKVCNACIFRKIKKIDWSKRSDELKKFVTNTEAIMSVGTVLRLGVAVKTAAVLRIN